ncbi:uncharacterized protein LOC131842553 isoform X2 [Achroia grisella]|uniref:uncharacterized protein LOC131842553 isoform X2 n=1 Tax=Achroia grisella TaxID=688607 RepID=UPI0027D1EE9B|nr:uncharacterized protein LOC131842553 isoform X2 [Achroia grisella]
MTISCIIFVILFFIDLVTGIQSINFTEYDSDSICPVSFFRRKRTPMDYTRWRANEENTQEFLVKVLDDDLTTSNTKQIIAINIQPVTKSVEKIIIGGAMLPPPTTSLPIVVETSRDYTRFVPPTTLPVSRVDGEVFLAPAPIIGHPILPKMKPNPGRHSLRDESPPASPQFLTRTETLVARQYAPIAPVAFTRRVTVMPVTPPLVDGYNLHNTAFIPTRTSHLSDMTLLTRSKHPEEFSRFRKEEINSKTDLAFLTRSSFVQEYAPHRTSIDVAIAEDIETPTKINTYFEDMKRNEINNNIKLQSQEKYYDASYNMMFYNEDDTESSIKKFYLDSGNNYDEKNLGDSISEKERMSTGLGVIESVLDSKNLTEGETEIYPYIYEEVQMDNSTIINKNMLSVMTPVESITVKTLKDKLRDKRRPTCNMIKLRPLNFNSPRTLPEIVSQLKQWAENSPVAKWVDITDGNFTAMENPIYMMMVDDPSSGQIVSAKQTVMIVAGIQGRDHHAVAAAMYALYQLIERSESHTDLLTMYRFWVIPVFNPDGYDYSITFPQRREWSKNLRQSWETCTGRESCRACESYGLRCTTQPCYGVNLDRNFEYQWIPTEELRAEHPCGALYAGARQLSEAETRALTHFLHTQRTPLYTFLAFKEGEVLGVMYPYSHTRKKRAFDHVYTLY